MQGLADALVKLVALQPIQFDCLRAGEYVHAARDYAVDLLLGFAAEVGSECRRPCCFRIGAVNAGQGDGAPGAGRRLGAADPLNDFDRRPTL